MHIKVFRAKPKAPKPTASPLLFDVGVSGWNGYPILKNPLIITA